MMEPYVHGGTVLHLSTSGYVSYEWSSTGTNSSEIVNPTTNTTYIQLQ